MDIERVVVRLTADASQYFGILDEVESRLMAFGSYTILHAITSVAKLGMEWEAMTVSFNTMIGSAERGSKALGEIRDLAIKTPYTTQGLTKAGELLLGYGTEAENLLPILSRLGDVSGGNQAKLMRLALAFGQVQSAGRLMGTELRQFAEAGVGSADFAKSYGTTPSRFVRDVKAGKVGVDTMVKTLNDLTDPGGRFAGKSDSLFRKMLGQVNALNETFQKFGADAAVKIFERFGTADKIGELANFLDRILNQNLNPILNWAERAYPILQEIWDFGKADFMAGRDFISSIIGEPMTLESVRDMLRGLFDGVMSGAETTIGWLEKAQPILEEYWLKPMIEIGRTTANIITMVETLIDKLGGFEKIGRRFMDSNPIGWVADIAADSGKSLDDRIKGHRGMNFLSKVAGGFVFNKLFPEVQESVKGGIRKNALALFEDKPFIGLAGAWGDALSDGGDLNSGGGGAWMKKQLEAFGNAIGDKTFVEKTRQFFQNQKEFMEKERKRTDFLNQWNKPGGVYGLGKAGLDIFLGLQGFGRGFTGKRISTDPRFAPDLEKFAMGIEKDYNNQFAINKFAMAVTKIRQASETVGPEAAIMMQLFGRGAQFTKTQIGLNPLLNKQQAEFGLFDAYTKLKKAVDVDASSRLPQAIAKGTREAQEIINRSQTPEMSIQQEILRVMAEAKEVQEKIKEYQGLIVPELQKLFPEVEKMAKALQGGDEV